MSKNNQMTKKRFTLLLYNTDHIRNTVWIDIYLYAYLYFNTPINESLTVFTNIQVNRRTIYYDLDENRYI